MPASEWMRFLNYVEHEVRPQCRPQRETLRGGPFEWVQTLSGKVFGEKVGPLIIRFFLQDEYQKGKSRDYDFLFREWKVELKTGVEHSTPGVFLFEQIRPTQDWNILLCLGIATKSLIFFVLSRKFVENAIRNQIITSQHPGMGTFWLWTKPGLSQMLNPYRSAFGPSGWQGQRLQDALSDIRL